MPPSPRVGLLSSLGLIALIHCVTPTEAHADAVEPPPRICPPGHRPVTGHQGPHCRPPPPSDCPANHRPRVRRDKAYCEPPPAKPCPPGSYWESTSATSGYCLGGIPCSGAPNKGIWQCQEASLCVKKTYVGGRVPRELVSKTCVSNKDCSAKERCVRAKRSAPKDGRLPASRPQPGSCVRCEAARGGPNHGWLAALLFVAAGLLRRRGPCSNT